MFVLHCIATWRHAALALFNSVHASDAHQIDSRMDHEAATDICTNEMFVANFKQDADACSNSSRDRLRTVDKTGEPSWDVEINVPHYKGLSFRRPLAQVP